MMSIGDKVIAILMGVCIICAVSTIVSYLLYTLWDIGEAYFSTLFFLCSMIGASCLMLIGIVFLTVGGVLRNE